MESYDVKRLALVLSVQASINCGIPFIAAVPFKDQELNWSEKVQKYFNNLLKKAESVTYVSEEGYSAYKMQIRNEWMVNNCDLLLAVWDGTEGGTYNCIKYARGKGKEIINLIGYL